MSNTLSTTTVACIAASLSAVATAFALTALPAGGPAQDAGKAKDAPAVGAPAKEPQMSPEEAALMNAWAKYAEIGPEQQWLAKWVGSWECKAEFWMVPGAPAQTSVGTCTYESVYGGRFLRQDYQGTMGEGMEFQGTGYVCFDNARQKFLHIWFDSASSGWSSGIGTGGSATNEIDWASTEPDIAKGGAKAARGVQRLVDENTLVLENYEPSKEGDRLVMRLTFTRAGSGAGAKPGAK